MKTELRSRIREIVWIWSEILRPQDRWVFTPDPDDGHCWCSIDWGLLWIRLHQEYERQVRAELRDPEWPSPWWEKQKELREYACDD